MFNYASNKYQAIKKKALKMIHVLYTYLFDKVIKKKELHTFSVLRSSQSCKALS